VDAPGEGCCHPSSSSRQFESRQGDWRGRRGAAIAAAHLHHDAALEHLGFVYGGFGEPWVYPQAMNLAHHPCPGQDGQCSVFIQRPVGCIIPAASTRPLAGRSGASCAGPARTTCGPITPAGSRVVRHFARVATGSPDSSRKRNTHHGALHLAEIGATKQTPQASRVAFTDFACSRGDGWVMGNTSNKLEGLPWRLTAPCALTVTVRVRRPE